MNFSWLKADAVAGCRGPRTDAELVFLASVGITDLVRLAPETETGIESDDVQKSGLEDLYEPVTDYTAPSQEQIDRVVKFIKGAVAQHRAVAVSCGAGCGRTGTILACYMVTDGLSSEAAIQTLIQARPCSREILRVPGQQQAIISFHQRLLGHREK